MTISRRVSTAVAITALAAISAPVVEGAQRAGPSRQAVGRAVPRSGPPVGVARPYRPYYYPYRRGLSLGFYAGYPYSYYPYSYYPYRYYPYGNYPYRYGYGYYVPYGYPTGYVTAVPGVAYGGVRIQGAPGDAQVFADGYYVGVVDDFDGVFQQLSLPPGPHRIEIREAGNPPLVFDVRIEPGQTITYRAR
jgi:hypothetical protein